MNRRTKECLKDIYRVFKKNTIYRFQTEKNRRFAEEYYYFHGYGIKEEKDTFVNNFSKKAYCEPIKNSKAKQLDSFVEKLDIHPCEGYRFFYCIDTCKGLEHDYPVLTNHSLDYSLVVNSSFCELSKKYIDNKNDDFSFEMNTTIAALKKYVDRIKRNKDKYHVTGEQIEAIESLWERPAVTMFEALQRILFVNQFMWQTGHNDIGLGHLDWVLDRTYKIANDKLDSYKLIKEFCMILHENYMFKSAIMPGDTGQYILLGGLTSQGEYKCNDLTYIFLKLGMELNIPDPKTILRYSKNIPGDLFELALDSIARGTGSPLLSNDDEITKDLISAGIEKKDAFQYATSACWEPLIPQKGCDQNNSEIINFAQPFVDLCETEQFEKINSANELLASYLNYLEAYLRKILERLSYVKYEEDLLLTLFSECALSRRKNIVRGGAIYNNIGLTSTGLGTVVNSILNIERMVWSEKKYSLDEINKIRKTNFENNAVILNELKSLYPCYGSDDKKVLYLTNHIVDFTSKIMIQYKTQYNGNFKFGLSSPGYIEVSKNMQATFDGRKNGDPFTTHISSSFPLPLTELFLFSTKLDYSENRYNGNVVDIMVSFRMINENKNIFKQLLIKSFEMGLFQIQINVQDSKILQDAKKHPEKYPNLIVRVWGFSAYFNDLPEEYKDNLIKRAKEMEHVA